MVRNKIVRFQPNFASTVWWGRFEFDLCKIFNTKQIGSFIFDEVSKH